MHETIHLLKKTDFPKINRRKVETLQVNLGYKCNQSCVHCHVDAGPNRTEMMSAEIIDTVINYLQAQDIQVLDVTGGAPELHPRFRDLVKAARKQSRHVIDRCNLTILEEPGHENLASFLAYHQVEIVASLPCYLEKNRQPCQTTYNIQNCLYRLELLLYTSIQITFVIHLTF